MCTLGLSIHAPRHEIEVDRCPLTAALESLRYDSVAGQFIQNWKSPKTPGSCVAVTVKTIDGSLQKAFFEVG